MADRFGMDRGMPVLQQGDRISNYLLETRLGAGSFGEVWRARHHVFDDIVAIKIPTDSEYVRNLQREGVAAHGLRHPNVVRAIDLDPYSDPPYFVMEYIEGPSLREVVDRYGATLPIPAVVTITRGILHGLTAAHDSGLIHRDLKPANVLLNRPLEDMASITEQDVRVTDFGLGHVCGATMQSVMQSQSRLAEDGRDFAGTLAYMSPEQKQGGQLDGRSDLYACGIVLFEMLVGERPQGNETPGSLRAGVPLHLNEVFRRSYARRERRYGSAGEMLAALGAARPADIPPPPPAFPQASDPECPACCKPVHRDDQFCIHCGHQLVVSVPQCTACRGYVHSGDRFCILCGNDLRVLDS